MSALVIASLLSTGWLAASLNPAGQGLLLLTNLAAALAYSVDKSAARAKARRIPEIVLLSLSFAGVFGASVARHWLRHKTQHPLFAVVLSVAVAATALLPFAFLL